MLVLLFGLVLHFSPVTEEEVEKIIRLHKVLLCGPCTNLACEGLFEYIHLPFITGIINQSFENGVAPKAFKLAAITSLLTC